jgi:hypothetical protein
VLPQRLRRLARSAALAASLGGLLPGSFAHAQDASSIAKANAAFARGIELEGSSSWADALAEFQTAAALVGHDAPQTELHIGRCQAKLGLLVEAWTRLSHSIELAESAGAKNVEKAARDDLELVTPRIPTLTLLVPALTKVAKVTIDGRTVPPESVGTPLRLNAVEHEVVVELAGGGTFRRTVTLREGAKESVSVEGTGDAASNAASTSTSTPTTTPTTTSTSNPTPTGTSRAPAPLGYILLGSGALVAVGGVVFWVLRGNEISTIDSLCSGNRSACPPNQRGAVDSDGSTGQAYTAAAIAMFAVAGAAAVVGGGVLLFGGKGRTSTSARFLPYAGPHGTGAALSGSF